MVKFSVQQYSNKISLDSSEIKIKYMKRKFDKVYEEDKNNTDKIED